MSYVVHALAYDWETVGGRWEEKKVVSGQCLVVSSQLAEIKKLYSTGFGVGYSSFKPQELRRSQVCSTRFRDCVKNKAIFNTSI